MEWRLDPLELINVYDVKRANGGQKLLLAFDVRVSRQAANFADAKGIEVLQSGVIYELLELFQVRKKSISPQLGNPQNNPRAF